MIENPRLAGIKEHLRRAESHLAEAHQVKDYDSAFPKLIAAVYPARAALELMREAAKAGELTIDLGELDRRITEAIPRNRLIQAIRIRDFHHFGIQGGGRILVTFQMRMPPLGHAEFSMYPNPLDPQAGISISDPTSPHKFLLTSDVVVQDEKEPVAIPYWILLREYLDQMKAFLPTFEAGLRKPKGRQHSPVS